MNKNVTVVVPVYKDWATLKLCISSLKEHLDPKHKVLIVNDCGPEADELEQKIKNAIEGQPNFVYERNSQNLGFVKTCNRAVLELDQTDNDILLLNSDTKVTAGFVEEMLAGLYSLDRIGAVCPRSNKATIFSVPFHFEGEREGMEEESFRAWEKIKELLPRFRKVPTGVGFCLLIQRDLIRNFGLFDEVYALGYNEENDFCSRINCFGYSVLMANQAFVFHYESKSFTSEQKSRLQRKNTEILNKRYPEFPLAVEKYYTTDVHPVDHFSDLIAEIYPKKKILISLYNLPPLYNGTSEQGLALINSFQEQFGDKYDLEVLTNPMGDKFHQVSQRFKTIYIKDIEKQNRRYDLVLVPSQIFEFAHLTLLNRLAVRIMVVMQDIISWRSHYLVDEELEMIGRSTLQYSDSIIAISNFTKRDIESFFPEEFYDKDKIKVVLEGSKKISHLPEIPRDNRKKIPKDYILILGNHFKHKAINKLIEIIKDIDRQFVVLGADEKNLNLGNVKNVTFFRSGFLSDELVEGLYAHCRLMLFPSQYEGFGIPVAKAYLYNRPIIAYQTDVNLELKELFAWQENQFTLFKFFDQVPALIEKTLQREPLPKKIVEGRGWSDYAAGIEENIARVLAEPIDSDKLLERWNYFNMVSVFVEEKKSREAKFGLNDVINKLSFVIFHPMKFYTKHKNKPAYLWRATTFAFKTEGAKKTIKRSKNFLKTGRGTLK